MNTSVLRLAPALALAGMLSLPSLAATNVVKFDDASGAETEACLSVPREVSTASASQAVDRTIAEAQTALALELLRILAAENPKSATISASPSSIAAVFSGLALGSDDVMKRAISKTLRLSAGKEAGLDRLRAALRRLDVGRATSPIQSADALFVDTATRLKPGITETLLAEARIPVRSAALNSAEGVTAINAFVSDTTKGRIPTILDGPTPGAALVAVNAFHFRDCWNVAFDPARTIPTPFHKADGSVTEVLTMRIEEQPLAHATKGRFVAVDLSYRDPGYSMTLVTTKDAPAGAEAFGAAAKLLAGEGFEVGPLDLALPSFRAQGTHDLINTLSGLGLKVGLASPKALSGLADGIALSAVHQKTLVAVDEKGTVAAAATAAVATRSATGPRVEKIAFDKPFVFALRHRPTGLVLMTGYVGEPQSPRAPER